MASQSASFEARLLEIAHDTAWLVHALRIVRDADVPHGYIGAGAVRNAVWDFLHGYSEPSRLADVDVAYFDPSDLSEASEMEYERRLKEGDGAFQWDVKNQAAVHLWFHRAFRHSVEPLHSMEEAVATWPEPAVCVALRLTGDETIEVVAPLGLSDLFGMVVRRNARRVSATTYRERVEAKRYWERWPLVQVLGA